MLTEYTVIKQLIDWLKSTWKHNYDFVMHHKKWKRVLVRQDNPMDLSIKFSLCDCAGNEYYNITYTQRMLIENSNLHYIR
jgi:hypothetical protein